MQLSDCRGNYFFQRVEEKLHLCAEFPLQSGSVSVLNRAHCSLENAALPYLKHFQVSQCTKLMNQKKLMLLTSRTNTSLYVITRKVPFQNNRALQQPRGRAHLRRRKAGFPLAIYCSPSTAARSRTITNQTPECTRTDLKCCHLITRKVVLHWSAGCKAKVLLDK